jgi:2-phosphoglycerate kinase
MLYIISGASRSGKTITAQKVATQKGIPYLSLDWIMMGFTNGIPEYGIHDKLFPDEIAIRLWSFLKAMLESMIYGDADCVIEGEAILPELITDLITQYPDKLTICFLGYIDVNVEKKTNEIRNFSNAKNDWLEDKPDEYIIDHVKNMIAHSRKIKNSCREYDLKYFDTSQRFMDAIDDTVKYLLSI